MTDFAVVVAVARYPDLSATGVAPDLDGPNNDALLVRDWLVDPDGGRLDAANVRVVRSADFDPLDPDDPQPARGRIERELRWVATQTADTAGNRLYLYFSGHGFSPVLEEGALFTAEASLMGPEYVYAHAWLRWFRRAQLFRETVLWMDSCMNYQQSVPVTEVLMRPKLGTGVPGPAFIALAAQTKSALEFAMSDGQVHGVFTWTLLQGLRGGAADERGRVTGESLRSFLYTVMPEFMPADVKSSAFVDLQPFVRADEGMVFRRLQARPKYPVRLVLPDNAVGNELRIWTGRPLAQAASVVLAGKEWTGELVRGLYLVEVPAAGLRHGFQVSGSGPVEEMVSRTGTPVTLPDSSALFSLDVATNNPAAAISVMDHQFDRIFSETGELHERDLPGVYKVRIEFGRDITRSSDEVLVLDRDTQTGQAGTPQLSSPAPIPGTAATHEFHEAPFEEAAVRADATALTPTTSVITLLVRYWTEPAGPAPIDGDAADPDGSATATATDGSLRRRHPMEGLRLLDAAGQPVADLAKDSRVDRPDDVDPVAAWEQELAPGPYFLRQDLPDGRQYEGCVVAVAGWVTQLAVQRTPQRGSRLGAAAGTQQTGGETAIADVAIFMRRPGVPREPDQDATVEGARQALAQGRNLFTDGRGTHLADLLLTKFADPVAGIIGAHLLLAAMNPAQPDPVYTEKFDNAVRNLRSLVGSDHPDVEALSLRCTDTTLRAARPFTAPPMFRQSWQLIMEASYQDAELVPIGLWERAHASVALGAFFVWAADEKTREAHVQQLSRWIDEYAVTGEAQGPPLPDVAREAAARLHVPASVAEMLWTGRESRQAQSVSPEGPSQGDV